jgi:hypothetical protein
VDRLLYKRKVVHSSLGDHFVPPDYSQSCAV